MEERESSDRDNSVLRVNDSFNSFKELTQKIEEFQNKTFSIFKIRDCVTKNKGENLKRNKILSNGIEYYSIKYVCKHGGRKGRPSTSKGKREVKTFQLGCGANFSVLANTTGNALVITSMDLSHNHVTSKSLFECLPENRRLNAEEKEIAKQQIQELGANKKS